MGRVYAASRILLIVAKKADGTMFDYFGHHTSIVLLTPPLLPSVGFNSTATS